MQRIFRVQLKQTLPFMIDCSKADFYEKMNKMTKKELKMTAEFMQSAETTTKNK